MYRENTALVETMVHLRRLGIPSLSVHDALIARLSDVKMAARLFYDHHYAVAGAPSTISTKSKLPGASEGCSHSYKSERTLAPIEGPGF
jgi:hypothetical protein